VKPNLSFTLFFCKFGKQFEVKIMLTKFINYLRYEKRYSERTVSIYSESIRQLLSSAGVNEDDTQALSELTSVDVRTWMANMLRSGQTTRTINLKISAANRFFRFLLRENVIDKNPLQNVQRPKTSKRLPEFFEEKALKDYLNSDEKTEDFIALRDMVIIELLYVSGIRRAELLSLRPCDIFMPENVLRITGKGDKQREVPLPQTTIERLQNYFAVRQETFPTLTATDKLFVSDKGKSLYPYVINRVVAKCLAHQEGFTGKKSPHVLRHSLATHLLNNGADIMSIKETLGHSSLAATQVYTHNSFKKLKNIYEKAHPRAKRK